GGDGSIPDIIAGAYSDACFAGGLVTLYRRDLVEPVLRKVVVCFWQMTGYFGCGDLGSVEPDHGYFFLCDGKPESVTAERTDVHRVLQRVGAGGGLRPDGRIDQPSFVIDAEDPETAEVIRDDQVRLVSG